jgi:heat shock protein HtpX
MSEAAHSALVYDRIDANRRKTFLLLAGFAGLLLPIAYVVSRYVAPQAVVAAIVLAIGVAWVGYRWTSGFLLRRIHARELGRDEEPDVRQVVENLCIGAGLPQPTLYLVDSVAPNAFATGLDPNHAALAVTHGLLRLLDRRELEGVVAHELSHIGNHDTRLSTMVAAIAGTMTFPVRAVIAAYDLAPAATLVILMGVVGASSLLQACIDIWGEIGVRGFVAPALMPILLLPSRIIWDAPSYPLALALLAYALLVTPAAAILLRKIISQEREFLADADAALLTRDPEGLGLALAKIGAARSAGLSAGAATVHLYFVDPLQPDASWLDKLLPSHPPIIERINQLAAMGDGIPSSALEQAVQRGSEYVERAHWEEVDTSAAFATHVPPRTPFRLTQPRTLVYKAPDGTSPVLEELLDGAEIRFLARDQIFVHVQTADGTVGYISRSTEATRLADHVKLVEGGVRDRKQVVANVATSTARPGTQFRLTDDVTVLYSGPDAASEVKLELPAGTVITANGLVEHFARVEVAGTAGYIAGSAPVDRVL